MPSTRSQYRPTTIAFLPPEMLEHICSFLPPNDVKNIRLTNRFLHNCITPILIRQSWISLGYYQVINLATKLRRPMHVKLDLCKFDGTTAQRRLQHIALCFKSIGSTLKKAKILDIIPARKIPASLKPQGQNILFHFFKSSPNLEAISFENVGAPSTHFKMGHMNHTLVPLVNVETLRLSSYNAINMDPRMIMQWFMPNVKNLELNFVENRMRSEIEVLRLLRETERGNSPVLWKNLESLKILHRNDNERGCFNWDYWNFTFLQQFQPGLTALTSPQIKLRPLKKLYIDFDRVVGSHETLIQPIVNNFAATLEDVEIWMDIQLWFELDDEILEERVDNGESRFDFLRMPNLRRFAIFICSIPIGGELMSQLRKDFAGRNTLNIRGMLKNLRSFPKLTDLTLQYADDGFVEWLYELWFPEEQRSNQLPRLNQIQHLQIAKGWKAKWSNTFRTRWSKRLRTLFPKACIGFDTKAFEGTRYRLSSL